MTVINQTLKIAHRGASGYAAENSLAAFKKAIELDVDIIEADVQLTADNVPIIRHDRFLDRTTNSKGLIIEHSWEELKSKVRLNNGESILSLEEFCALIAPHRQSVYLDIKTTSSTPEIIKIALSQLKVNRVFIGSFHHRILPEVKRLNPEIQTIMIIEAAPVSFKSLVMECGCDIVGLGYDAIEKRCVDEIHSLDRKVFTWTVNHPHDILNAKSLGVDGITSDFPDRI